MLKGSVTQASESHRLPFAILQFLSAKHSDVVGDRECHGRSARCSQIELLSRTVDIGRTAVDWNIRYARGVVHRCENRLTILDDAGCQIVLLDEWQDEGCPPPSCFSIGP